MSEKKSECCNANMLNGTQCENCGSAGKAKKQIITAKSKKHKNIIQLIRKRRDIYDQFVLSLTYNTNRIEGSTLNEAQTAAILFDNITFSNKKLFEHIEVKNHQTALAYLFKYVSENNKLNEAFILKIHSLLLNGIQEDAGLYRKHGVRIVGANVPTANYLKIPQLMKEIVKDINRQKKDIISHVSEIHSRFEQVHPFSDGNGRIGRLIIHAMLLKKNIPPTIITVKKKKIYLSVLNKAQVKNELVPLEDFICDSILESYSMIEKSM